MPNSQALHTTVDPPLFARHHCNSPKPLPLAPPLRPLLQQYALPTLALGHFHRVSATTDHCNMKAPPPTAAAQYYGPLHLLSTGSPHHCSATTAAAQVSPSQLLRPLRPLQGNSKPSTAPPHYGHCTVSPLSATTATAHKPLPLLRHYGHWNSKPLPLLRHHGRWNSKPLPPLRHHGHCNSKPLPLLRHYGRCNSKPLSLLRHHGHCNSKPLPLLRHYGHCNSKPLPLLRHYGHCNSKPLPLLRHYGHCNSKPLPLLRHYGHCNRVPHYDHCNNPPRMSHDMEGSEENAV
ncbi:unnamed protein product [Boreogadus saida]